MLISDVIRSMLPPEMLPIRINCVGQIVILRLRYIFMGAIAQTYGIVSAGREFVEG